MSEQVTLSTRLLDAALSAHRARIDHLAAALDDIDPQAIAGDTARTAFWLNIYNALLLDEFARNPRRGSLLRHRGLFASASYRVGGDEYSLNVIEHGVLRLNARPPYGLRRALRGSDARARSAPSRLDPRIHFALNCGAVSCPPIRAYTAAGCDAELAAVARAYIAAETSIDRRGNRIELPGLLKLYAADFGDRRRRIEFVANHMSSDDAAWLAERGDNVAVAFGRFDWTIASGS